MSKPPSRNVTVVALGLLLATCLVLQTAQAWAWGFKEWGLGVFFHNDIDIEGGNLDGMGINLATAGPLWDNDSLRLDFRLEGGVAGFWNYGSGVEVSLVPGLRLYFPGLGKYALRPFLEGGIGPSWDHLNINETGSELNFLSFGGLGLRLPMSGWNLDLGYRVRHISNAGLDEHNHGITSNLFQLALVWDM